MSPKISVDIDALLAPATGSAPAGVDLRYLLAYDEIRRARKLAEARRDQRGDDETDANDVILWKEVARLSSAALAKSKDLQVGIWLLEALAHVDAYEGVSTGLVVIKRLLAEYWDGLYPQIDPDDADSLGFRTALLNWIDERLTAIIKLAPLTPPPTSYGVLHYEVTLRTGEEKQALLDQGQWPSREQIDKALDGADLTHLDRVLGEIVACEAGLAPLQSVVDERYAAAPTRSEKPSFLHLKEALATARHILERPIKKKRPDLARSNDPSSPSPGQGDANAPSTDGAGDANSDSVWSYALTATRDSRLDGLRLLQDQVAAAAGGRDWFLKELQLAELCLEAGVHALAYPIFEALTSTIDARRLEEWEEHALVARVWTGLVRCCALLEKQIPTAVARGKEIQDRLAAHAPTQAPTT